MVTIMKLTQEEEIVQTLQREGFQELSEQEIRKEPYTSIYRFPDCFQETITDENRQQSLVDEKLMS